MERRTRSRGSCAAATAAPMTTSRSRRRDVILNRTVTGYTGGVMTGRRGVAVVALLVAAGLSAQTGAPRFEVVSIRVVPPSSEVVIREADFTAILPGGRYIDSRSMLFSMIAYAYDVKNASRQL